MIVFGTTLTTTDRGHLDPLGREDVPFRRAEYAPRLGSEMMELPTHPMARRSHRVSTEVQPS